MSDILQNIPIVEPVDTTEQDVLSSVQSIRSLVEQMVYGRQPSKPGTPLTTPKVTDEEAKPAMAPPKESPAEKSFFDRLGDKFSELTSDFKKAGENIAKNVGELGFGLLLGPLQLITKPFEGLTGMSFFDLFGKLIPKPFRGRPTKSKVLPKDPGAVLIANTLTKTEEEGRKGFLEGLFGEGGFLKNLIKGAGPILAKAGLLGIFAALTLSDILGPGGALEFFKKGEFARGIFTALFGKSLAEKGTVGRLLGIGKQALKWGALGFAIGGPLGGLIGLGIGAAGAAIKLGVDTGFFEKVWKGAKKWSKIIAEWVKVNLFEPIMDAFKNIWQVGRKIPVVGLIFQYAEMVFRFWRSWFEAFVRFFRTVFKDPVTAFKQLGLDLWNAITTRFTDLFNLFPSAIEDVLEIGKLAGEVGEAIFGMVRNLVNNIAVQWQAFKADPTQFIKDLIENVKTKVLGFFNGLFAFFDFLQTFSFPELLKMFGEAAIGKGPGIREQFEQFQGAKAIAELDPSVVRNIESSAEFQKELARGRKTRDELIIAELRRTADAIIERAPNNIIQQVMETPYTSNRVNRGIMSDGGVR